MLENEMDTLTLPLTQYGEADFLKKPHQPISHMRNTGLEDCDLDELRWNTQFDFFHYNDHEVFFATDSELGLRAKEFAENGVNHVITFGVTHFRWSFQRDWPAISKALERIVKIFGEYGIKVTEHHSSVFLYDPLDSAGEAIVQDAFDSRKADRNNWQSFRESTYIDKSLQQIDGCTGEPRYFDFYAARIMCPNNPDFVSLYLNYLEQNIYSTGVAGIMTDDINVDCTCRHCREKFAEYSGITMPEDGIEWEKWSNEVNSEAYHAWILFRQESGRRFHEKVMSHYEGLNLRLLRPNYIATAINFTYHKALHNFDDLPALDWAFQENMSCLIPRYAWPEWLVEAWHRNMVAYNRKIPSMSMFYPDREDSMKFYWALAMGWGQKYIGTCHDPEINLKIKKLEKPLRGFEEENKKLLQNSRKFAEVAFYDSFKNRLIYADYNSCSARMLCCMMQGCSEANIQYEMINGDFLDTLDRYKLIVLPQIMFFEEHEIRALEKYVNNGGRILVLGECSINFKNQDIIPWRKTDFPVPNRVQVDTYAEELQKEGYILSEQEKKQRNIQINKLKQSIKGKLDFEVLNAPEDLMFTVFEAQDKTRVIHIVNAYQTMTVPHQNGIIKFEDPVPFPSIDKDIFIKIKNFDLEIADVKFLTLDKKDLSLDYERRDEYLIIHVPPFSIEWYALIEIKTQKK